METGKCKHNYLKELWLNRPWVYIPEVVRFMRKYPYHKKTDCFWTWIRNCFCLNWQVCWRMVDNGKTRNRRDAVYDRSEPKGGYAVSEEGVSAEQGTGGI